MKTNVWLLVIALKIKAMMLKMIPYIRPSPAQLPIRCCSIHHYFHIPSVLLYYSRRDNLSKVRSCIVSMFSHISFYSKKFIYVITYWKIIYNFIYIPLSWLVWMSSIPNTLGMILKRLIPNAFIRPLILLSHVTYTDFIFIDSIW